MTLEQLIEQCGEAFESLVRVRAGEYVDAVTGEPLGVMWKVYATDYAYYSILKGECVNACCGDYMDKTPEGAVQKLLDALNIAK